jgi:hypothetical protein
VALPLPEPGLVISYSYLWQSEYRQEREEGLKDRPCAIILAAQDDDGRTIVTVLPITHSPPQDASDAVELPLVVKKRLGLDEARSWVVVSEVNRFAWPGPDLRAVSRDEPERFEYGLLPPSLFRQIRDRFLAAAAAQRLQIVPRTE